jgi:hypothetical protein
VNRVLSKNENYKNLSGNHTGSFVHSYFSVVSAVPLISTIGLHVGTGNKLSIMCYFVVLLFIAEFKTVKTSSSKAKMITVIKLMLLVHQGFVI